MEFEEHEDPEEEEEEEEMDPTTGGGGAPTTNTFNTRRKPSTSTSTVRYRECLKNHAVGIGGHTLDGCGEFMAAGDEGTLDALKCAACNCHRNFHRKETITHNSGGGGGGGGGLLQQPQPHYHHHGHHLPYYGRPPPPAPPSGYLHLTPPQQANRAPAQTLAIPVAAASGGGNYNYNREEVEDVSNPSSSGGGGGGGGGGGSSRKRFRTKFTQEQKDKMLELAERLGWRMQRHDDDVVHQFCIETGVSRQVLKVWMHNNKHTLGKKP